MKIYRDANNNLVVLRESNEKRLYLESTFYRHLANQINKLLSIDTIPKEMCKDGHMVDNGRFYLTDRKRRYYFYQNDWATYDINRDYFNKNIPITLLLNTDDFDMSFLSKLPLWGE